MHLATAAVTADPAAATSPEPTVTDVIARSPSRPGRSPDIITELPGPRPAQHIAFDEPITSPSLPRAYPLVPVRGEG